MARKIKITKHGKVDVQHFDLGGIVSGAVAPVGQVLGGVTGSLYQGLGLNNNFQPGVVDLNAGYSPDQITGAYQSAQRGINQQQLLADALSQQNGFGNQTNILAQQQALANALQAQSMGQGPNPAQAALNQATGQNVAGQAALMAGQRGASANAGLIARQVGQQGAGIQQQAIGQAATLQAQQQIAAQQQLAQQQAAMQNVAGNQIAGQMQGVSSLNGLLQNQQALLQNANTAFNSARTGQQSGLNQIGAQTALGNQHTRGQLIGGVLNGGAALAGAALAKGGMVPDHVGHIATIYHPEYDFACGGEMGMADGGGVVPGKPKVGGTKDVYKNDTQPAMLSPGEIVLPRSVTQSEDPAGNAAKFVESLASKKGHGDEAADFKRALLQAIKSRKK